MAWPHMKDASSLHSQMAAAMISFVLGVSLFSLGYLARSIQVTAQWQSQVLSYFSLFDQMAGLGNIFGLVRAGVHLHHADAHSERRHLVSSGLLRRVNRDVGDDGRAPGLEQAPTDGFAEEQDKEQPQSAARADQRDFTLVNGTTHYTIMKTSFTDTVTWMHSIVAGTAAPTSCPPA